MSRHHHNFGQGHQRGLGKASKGTGGFCVCPQCGYAVNHQDGIPCRKKVCPNCNVTLQRSETKAEMNELKPDKKEETIPEKKVIKKLFPKVDSDKCNACGECIEVCPRDTIVLKNGKAFVELDKCTNCRICMKVCPENAFILE